MEEKGRRRIRIKKRSLSLPSIEVELLFLPLLLLRPQVPSVFPPFLAEFNFSKRHTRKRRRRKKREGFVSLPSLSLLGLAIGFCEKRRRLPDVERRGKGRGGSVSSRF